MKLLLLAAAIAAALLGIGAVLVLKQPGTFSSPFKHPRRVLLEEHLKKYANDPASVEIQELMYSRRGDRRNGQHGQHVMVLYRDRNAFGALQINRRIYLIENDQHVSRGLIEEQLEKMWDREEWSANPDGPRSAQR